MAVDSRHLLVELPPRVRRGLRHLREQLRPRRIGLREHRVGESLRHVSWKAYAQGKGLLTKTFQGHARPSLWIDWQQLTHGSQEDRLSFMTALVLAAESEEQKYGLRLPGKVIEQGYGKVHKHQCLKALALFNQSDTAREFPLDGDS